MTLIWLVATTARGMQAFKCSDLDPVMANKHTDKLASGTLATAGVYAADEIAHACDVLDKIEVEKVETIRLVLVDQHGILRGKTLVASALGSAVANGVGMPSTLLLKDTAHKTVFPVWGDDSSVGEIVLQGASDVLAVPELATMTRIPWSPHSRIVLCNVLDRNKTLVPFSSRQVLKRAVMQLFDEGYTAVVGLEAEFQIFERIDDSKDHTLASMPPAAVKTRNLTQGWQYLTESRYGEVESILDRLRRTAEQMNLGVRTVEIEMGPSQFEFTFEPSDPVTQADRYVLFRTMVKEVCYQNGLLASFMAKPIMANAAANGWHIHQSLLCNESGNNVFMSNEHNTITDEASWWIAGLLQHAEASCLLTTPTVNGYKRYMPYQLAPNNIAWGFDNRGAMVRALLYANDPASRVENRVADSSVNPHFALAAQLICGLDGLQQKSTPPVATTYPYAEDGRKLPDNLLSAIQAFSASELYRETLGKPFVEYLKQLKQAEWHRYLMTVSEWEQNEYFNLF